MTSELHTVAETAQILKVRESWLKTKASARLGPCTFVGKHLRCSSNGGQCVEVANGGTAVAVRDSKDPRGSMLVFPPHQWGTFCAGVKRGDFDVS
jgi:hypothetical protein